MKGVLKVFPPSHGGGKGGCLELGGMLTPGWSFSDRGGISYAKLNPGRSRCQLAIKSLRSLTGDNKM